MSLRRLFLTGGSGFTGVHLAAQASSSDWEVCSLQGALEDEASLRSQLEAFQPDAIVHLAAISATTHADSAELYRVNVLGTETLLRAAIASKSKISKLVMASSAAIYGNSIEGFLDEETAPTPVSHYGISKLAMEFVAKTYVDRLPIVIARPFNYTGIGHDNRFVIPKIIEHYKSRAAVLELGNLQVEREFNDVRDVVALYMGLVDKGHPGQTYNICSSRPLKLLKVIDVMNQLTGYKPEIKVNPHFVRANEIPVLAGSSLKIRELLGALTFRSIDETLAWMLRDSAPVLD